MKKEKLEVSQVDQMITDQSETEMVTSMLGSRFVETASAVSQLKSLPIKKMALHEDNSAAREIPETARQPDLKVWLQKESSEESSIHHPQRETLMLPSRKQTVLTT